MWARWIGITLIATGILAMAGLLGPLGNYTYAITWWGILILIDLWNQQHRGLSLWSGRGARFAFVTLPFSVIFWLFFEVLNLASPQWRYRGGLSSVTAQVLFGFVSFATVIPIVVELYWLITGEFRVPPEFARTLRRHGTALAVAGAVLALLPFFIHQFWVIQGMWLAPALLLLPLTRLSHAPIPYGVLAVRGASAGLAAGLIWETLNWFSRTHWEYLILRSWPHLFQMPCIGYIGFIPFAFAVLCVYAFSARIPDDFRSGICLYVLALGGLYVLTVIYDQRGFWLGYDLLNSGVR